MVNINCAFHYAYPSPHENFDSGCQFDADEELFFCNRRCYCRLHLPLADDEGQSTDKADKSKFDPRGFSRTIHDFIDKALAEEKPVNLTGVVFLGDFAFECKKLPEILLYRAVFPGRANFEDTQFTGDASFEGAQFMRDASFKDAQFMGHASFKDAQFKWVALFEDARFKGHASFEHAQFMDYARFGNARFEGNASFLRTQFAAPAEFQGVVFTGYAVFQHAQFMIGASFGNAQFTGNAWFSAAQFVVATSFKGARFERLADFSWTPLNPFSAPSDMATHGDKQSEGAGSGASFPLLDFSGGRFGGSSNFSNRIFTEAAHFSGRIFVEAPLFHGSDIHQGTNWHKTVFREREGHDAERAYRTLRLAMEKIRDRPQEAIFFSLEQQARRSNLAWYSPTWWLSCVYDLTSGYGSKVGRPLLLLAATTFLFFMFYWYCGGGALLDGDVVSASVTLCVQQITQPFKIWSGTYLIPAGLFGGMLPLCVKIAASLQSVLSLTFLALFVLALRWQFRRA